MTIRRGTLKAYDAATYTATVQIVGSLALWLTAVPISRAISAGALVNGRTVAVAFFDDDVPTDSMVVGIN